MSNLTKFRKEQIKIKSAKKGYKKILDEGKADGSLMKFITKELANDMVKEQSEVLGAEIVEEINSK